MELESEWLEKLEKEDQKYAEFYKEPVKKIKLYCLYIDGSNNLKFGHRQIYKTTNNKITKDELMYIIKKNVKYQNVKYKPFSIIKYNFTLNPENIKNYLDNTKDYIDNFITSEKIETINFDETIKLFNDLNSLYILYYEPHKLENVSKTKKIIIKTKKLKTRKKKI